MRFKWEREDGELLIYDMKQGCAKGRYTAPPKSNPIAIVYDVELAQLIVDLLNKKKLCPFFLDKIKIYQTKHY